MTLRLFEIVERRRRRSAAVIVAAAFFAVGGWIRLGPIDPRLLDDSSSTSTVVTDRHGVVLYEALSGDGTRRVTLDAANLPGALVAATLAAEDHRFWSHPGIDPLALARAMKRNLAERAIVEGGSTISQQVAKLLLGRREPARRRGVRAKLQEAVLALRLEHRFTKRELLAIYLNTASYGNQIAGAERASRAYFGRPASMLTPAQAAFLAGLPQRPSSFNPYRSRDSALRRQRRVLRRMETAGLLTADQARQARDEQLVLSQNAAAFTAPHFVEMVLADGRATGAALARRSTAGDSRAKAGRIRTTLDVTLQADVTGIIESHRAILDRHGAANVAVVVLDNETGGWLAWEGSGAYFDAARGGTINGPRVARQPGSALKPFTYALAFERGFTPASVLPDVPSHFPTAEPGVLYSPRNYDGRYRGPLLARRALAGSENVPAVALASELGVPALLRFLQRAGLTTFDRTASHYGLGVTLGNAEVRLDELVAAYAAFARGGEWTAPSAIQGATGERRTLVSPRTAFWIGDILSDDEAREFIFGRGGSLEFPFPVAVKTGTSQAYHDNWTIGYTKRVTVGVWVGNFDRRPLRRSTGVTGAAPIFHAVMLAAERRLGPQERWGEHQPFGAPDAVVARDICALSGGVAHAWCPARRREWVPRDDPAVPCAWHHLTDDGLLVVWPAEYREWAQRSGLLARASIGDPPSEARRHAPAAAHFDIVNPPDGAVYSIDPTLRRDFQTLPLRVVSDRPGRVEWTVNGQRLGASDTDRAFLWPLTPGTHRLTARDRAGRQAETTVVVR